MLRRRDRALGPECGERSRRISVGVVLWNLERVVTVSLAGEGQRGGRFLLVTATTASLLLFGGGRGQVLQGYDWVRFLLLFLTTGPLLPQSIFLVVGRERFFLRFLARA